MAFTRQIDLPGWLQRAAYMPPLRSTRKIVIAAQESLPLGGKVARYAPDEGEMSGRLPLISHLR